MRVTLCIRIIRLRTVTHIRKPGKGANAIESLLEVRRNSAQYCCDHALVGLENDLNPYSS